MEETAHHDVLRRAEELINNREFEKARAYLEEAGAIWFSYSEVLLWLALAQRFCGDNTSANRTWQQARICPDYNAIRDGDFLRDAALTQILSLTNLADVHQLLALVCDLHKDDINRLAYAEMVRGKLIAAQNGNFKGACAAHQLAEDRWEALEENNTPGNPQWQYLNRVYYALHARYAGKVALSASLLGHILREFPHQNRGNRLLALGVCLHFVFGRTFATRLERFLKMK